MNSRSKAALWAILPLLLLIPLLVWLGKSFANQLANEQHTRTQHTLELHAAAVQRSLDRITGKLDSLEEFVVAQTAEGRTIQDEQFNLLAAGLRASFKWIRAFQIVSNGIITHIYPLPGNEAALGYNLLSDPRPVIGGDVTRALETGRVTITGPLQLVQGGLGIIIRKPLPRTQDRPAYLVAIVFNIAPLLADSGIRETSANEVQLAIRRDTGELFLGTPTVFAQQPVTHRLSLPDGSWEMGGHPLAGWQAGGSNATRLFYLAGTAIIGLVSLLVFLIARRQADLTETVAERTQALHNELTHRKQVEETIRQERDFSNAVLDSLPGVSYCYDEKLSFRRWNKNFERVTGFSSSELASKSPLDFFTGTELELIRIRIQEVFTTGRSEAEADFVAKDGTRTPYYFTGVSAKINGRPHLIGVGLDRSARKKAEAALREETLRRRIIFNSARDGMFLLNQDRRVVEANLSFAEMLGIPQDEVLKLHPWDWDVIYSTREKLLASWPDLNLELESFETRIRRRDGQIFDAEITQNVAIWAEQKHVLCVCRDISERKQRLAALQQSELEQRHLAQQLEVERARLVAAQSVAKVGSWETDLTTGIVVWSDETYRIFATDPASFHPTHQGFLELVHPEDRQAVDQALLGSLDKRGPCAIEHRVLPPGGEIKFVEERWQTFHDPEGKPVRAIGTCQDITERTQIEKQLRALTARLESLREDERIRISREIHDELGQKLTGLKMDLYWLENRLEQIGDEKLRTAMEEKLITASTTADETMVTVQRIAAELRPAMLDNLGLIATLRYETKQFEGRTGIPVNLTLPATTVNLDNEVATTTYRIFQEVLTNVARHAQATKVEATLEITEGKLQLRVEDNGLGVSPEDLLNTRSLGLLGMTERAALLHGRVHVEGAPGQGTIVRLEIPIDNAALADKQSVT